jgi:hypothetical protein
VISPAAAIGALGRRIVIASIIGDRSPRPLRQRPGDVSRQSLLKAAARGVDSVAREEFAVIHPILIDA